MKPLRARARRLGGGLARALALMMALIGALPAQAGHYTHERVIGFSEDGRYFAFKTYGLQRGSGLPFGNIFIVDLAHDTWVAGTPLRAGPGEEAMAEVEAAPYAFLHALRADLMQRAAPLIDELGLHRPATVLHAAGIGQAYGAPESLLVSVPHPDDPTAPPWHQFSLQLEPLAIPSAVDYCPRPEALRGFRLSLEQAGVEPRQLHRDQRIPASRGCAEAYRLDAVLSAGYPRGDASVVAMISVWSQGFEGLQRHVIALPVPIRMPATASGGNPQPAVPDLNALTERFLDGFEPIEPEALENALPARGGADASALRWPDADLPPAVRAVELLATQQGFAAHGRLWLHEERHELLADGAGGPARLSQIRVQVHNLGAARRAELIEIFGEAGVAAPEAFDPGPDHEWRFVMRPVQGMRAGLVAAGGRLLPVGADAVCGPAACQDPTPPEPERLGLACDMLAAESLPPLPGAHTAVARAMAVLHERTEADAWLIEHGLWQADATRIIAIEAQQPAACVLFLDRPGG